MSAAATTELHKQISANEKSHVPSDAASDHNASLTSKELAEPALPTNTIPPLDWDGPDDPDNPLNWSNSKKAFHTISSGLLGFAVTCGSSLITPAAAEIAKEFDVSFTAAILVLSLFCLGLGLGPCIAAPISETLGRRVVYRTTAICYLFLIMGAGFSRTFGSLLVCRLLAGMAGGPALAVGAGTNSDLYFQHFRAVPSTFFVTMPFLGPAIGPVIGSFAAQFKGWRWTQWCTIFVGIAVTIPLFFMSETYAKVILTKRAKKRGQPIPVSTMSAGAKIKLLLTITLFRPVRMLFTEPIVLLFSLYNAVGFGIMFSFFAAYPYVFETVYGLEIWQYGLLFLGLAVGVLIAATTGIVIDRKYYYPRYLKAHARGKERLDPEYRLLVAQMGAVLIPIALFWFGWTSRPNIHWIVPTLSGILFAAGNLAIFIGGALYLIDVYGPLNGASAVAANGLARYSLGGIFPLFTVQMFEGLGIGWAASLLGFVTLVMVPIPFVFFFYGTKVRAMSKMIPVIKT